MERTYNPAAVEEASAAIREMYSEQGQQVRVEYKVTQMPPRSVGIEFEVIQLCSCN